MPFVSSTLKSFEKWRSPLFGATGNSNHQILPYGILFVTFISTNPWTFPLNKSKFGQSLRQSLVNKYLLDWQRSNDMLKDNKLVTYLFLKK
jgi:hypothetical protein